MVIGLSGGRQLEVEWTCAESTLDRAPGTSFNCAARPLPDVAQCLGPAPSCAPWGEPAHAAGEFIVTFLKISLAKLANLRFIEGKAC
jgi:hypothetical protein